MRKFLAALFAFALAVCSPADAQRSLLLLDPLPVTGGGAPTFTLPTSGYNHTCGFPAGACNIASVTVPTGFIVVAAYVNNQSASTGTVSAVSVCGTGLTQAQTNSIPTGDAGVALYYGSVTGGSCTVGITFSITGSLSSVGVALGLLSNLSSTTPGTGCQAQYPASQAAPYNCSGSVTVNAGGFGICAIGYSNSTAMTSSNQTIDSQTNDPTPAAGSIGIAHFTTTETPAFGGVNNVQAGIACAPWS